MEIVYFNVCETILPASLQLNKCQSVNKKIDNLKALALHPNRQKCKAYRTWMGYYKRKQDSRTVRVDIYALLLSISLSPIAEEFSCSLVVVVAETRVKPNVVSSERVCVCRKEATLGWVLCLTWKKNW